MTNKLFNALTNVVSTLKRVRLERIFIVVLAGVLVVTSTACSPNSPSVSGTGSYDERAGQPTGLREYTDRADAKSRPDLGSYGDNDARDTASARAKAKALSDRAERNVQKVQNPGELVEEIRQGTPLNERVRNITDDVGNAAEQLGDDVAKGTQENLRNLKANTDKAGRNVQQTAKDAQRNVQETGKDVSRSTERAVKDASDYAKDRA